MGFLDFLEGRKSSDQSSRRFLNKPGKMSPDAACPKLTRTWKSAINKRAWAEKNARETVERRILRERAKLQKSPLGRRRAGFKTKSEYNAYRQSDEWKNIRKTIKERALGKCEICGKRGSDVHHRRYRPAGRSRNSDFLYLCRSCHRRIHGT
jgi:5-methylcytosine-specific restriction endonuclease McrA